MCFKIVELDEKGYKKALKEYYKADRKWIEKRGTDAMYETVKNNPNLFDREYYVEVLKEKGYTF